MSQLPSSPIMGEVLSATTTVSSAKSVSSTIATGLSSYPDNFLSEGNENGPTTDKEIDEGSQSFIPDSPPPPYRSAQLAICDPSDLDDLPPTVVNLLRAFEGDILTDLRIAIMSDTNRFPPRDLGVHRVMVQNSPSLAWLTSASRRASPTDPIRLRAGGGFRLDAAFEAALQTVYGLQVIDVDMFTRLMRQALDWKGCPYPIDGVRNKHGRMTFAICYTVSGAFLERRDILEAGMELIAAATDWETLEMALDFGLRPREYLITLDGDDQPKNRAESSPSTSLTMEGDENTVNDKDQDIKASFPDAGEEEDQEFPVPTEDADKNKSKNPSTFIDLTKEDDDDHCNKIQKAEMILPYELNKEVVDKCAPMVMRRAFEWMVEQLPSTFIFDRLAYVKQMPDRIPAKLRTEHHSPIAQGPNTLLSDVGPDRESSCASAILLALPFQWLQEAFAILNRHRVVLEGLVDAVLRERDYRRIGALRKYEQEREDKNPNPSSAGGVLCDLSSSLTIWLDEEKETGSSQAKEDRGLTKFLLEHLALGYREWFKVQKRQTYVDVVGILVEFELQQEWVGGSSIYIAEYTESNAQ